MRHHPSSNFHETPRPAQASMFFSIQKFLFQPSKTGRKERKKCKEEMLSPCLGCLHAPCLEHEEHANSKHRVAAINVTSARATRSEFAKLAASSLFSNSHFTNHESIPSLLDAFSNFAEAFPQYHETQQADEIRESEYSHLDDHVCLDYSGVNLFSHAQMNQAIASSSSSSSSPTATSAWKPPFFSISYKSASLKSEVQYGEKDRGFECGIRKRIMSFLKISGEEYGVVCTANRTAAFRLLGETYPFQSNKRLITVYDYESEAVSAMVESAEKRGAKVMSAGFSWPGMRIQTAKMKKMMMRGRKTEKKRGLLVFPHMSRMTGVRYPYLWMKLARENGWHVILDACTLGPKDMDTLGITLIQPDFIICSFFKVLGENPSGFAALFIKKSSKEVLQTSVLARSIGMVSLVRAGKMSNLPAEEVDTTSSFSGPISLSSKQKKYEEGETSEPGGPPVSAAEEGEDREEEEGYKDEKEIEKREGGEEEEEELSSEIVEVMRKSTKHDNEEIENQVEVEFHGLDHADSLGLLVIHNRLRYITNWLVTALMKLKHPHSENGNYLVKIYGPRVKFDRGPALAFNVFDWKGEKVNPVLVQKLADRSNISLSCGFLHHIFFSEKYEQIKDAVLEERVDENVVVPGNKKKEIHNLGIKVVSASFGYLANFEDAYRLWAFVAKFLDADFVEKERWRYVALNQKMIEL